MVAYTESKVEKHLRAQVIARGGLCHKMTSPGTRGVPDRLITWHGGLMFLVETKRPKGKTSKWQDRDHELRARLGVTVHVLHTIEEVDAWLCLL